MYKSFYKLRKSPFSLNPDPDFLYLSTKHKNALTVLERGLVNWVGLSVITGEKGTGKSTLIQHLLNKSWPDVTFGLISEPDHPPGGLLQRTLTAFGLNSFGKTTFESYDLLNDFMVIDCYWQKRQPVLIIDEALGMENEALEELYMLSTIEAEENRNLRIILVKPPSLWDTLKRPAWTHLAQRVGNSYHLEPLDYRETVAYVQHRLRVAEAQNENLFDVPAYKAIYRYSEGNPRLINVICNAALVQGSIQEKAQIGAALIEDLIKQKQVLLPATATPQGEAQGRSEVEGKKLDRTTEVQSDTDNFRPAKRDRTGQTVSEFIIADIDQASRKYARLDAEVSKGSDEHERTGTGEAHQGTANWFRRVASIAVIVLVAAAVAILVGRDRSTLESQSVQRDQDAQGQGLITASPPSEKVRQKIDQADRIQVDKESAPVARNLLAQRESRDNTFLLTGDAGVPEDATGPKEPSSPVNPEPKQSEPDVTENDLLAQRESRDNNFLLTGDAGVPEDATDPKEPSIPVNSEPKQSGPDGTQREQSAPHESRDNTSLLTGDAGVPEDATDPKEPSSPVIPEPKQTNPDVTENDLLAQRESRDNTSLLTGDAGVPEDATAPKEPSSPVIPEPKQTNPDVTENDLLAQRESRDNTSLLTGDAGVPEDATDPKELSSPVIPEPKQTNPDVTENDLLAQRESRDNTSLLTGDAGVPEDATDPKELSSPVIPEPKQTNPDVTENDLLAQRESRDNTSLLTGDAGVPEDATDPKELSSPVIPEPKQTNPDVTENDLLAQRESRDNTSLLTGDTGVLEDATDSKEPSSPLNPEPKQSEPDGTHREQSAPHESRDNTTLLTAGDEKRENVTDPKETSVPVDSDPKHTLPGGTESVEQHVAELLARAEQQIAARHLITPAGHAALETYQAILELVPGHRGALHGINRIKEQYVAWAEAARQRGQWVKAQKYAERAAAVDPRDSEVAQLLDQIKEERKLQAEVAALKKLEAENAEAAAKLQAEVAALKKLEAENAKAAVKLQEEVKALRMIAAEELKKTERQPVVPVQKVDNLLIKAQQQFEVQRLTQPVGDNAWETYQKVLQLDPSNQRARGGLQFIARRLESMARGKQQKGDLPASLAIVEDGLRAWPNHAGLLALKEEINRQLEAQRAAQQVEEQPAPTDDEEEPPEPKKKKRRRVKSFGTFF